MRATDAKGLEARELSALRRAAKRALRIGLETGTPVWVMRHGKMVDLSKEYALVNGQPRRRPRGRNGRSAK